MPVSSLFGKTYQILERSLDIATRRHSLIAGNVANLDTPGYKPKELDFKEALKTAVDNSALAMVRTHQRHLGPIGETLFEPFESEDQESVDIDREMSKIAENNLRYQTSAEILLRKFSALKNAIAEGGR